VGEVSSLSAEFICVLKYFEKTKNAEKSDKNIVKFITFMVKLYKKYAKDFSWKDRRNKV